MGTKVDFTPLAIVLVQEFARRLPGLIRAMQEAAITDPAELDWNLTIPKSSDEIEVDADAELGISDGEEQPIEPE